MSVRRWEIEQYIVRYPEYFAQRYREAGVWSDVTVGERFHEAALKYADQEAVVSTEGRMTYKQLDRESDRFAAALLRLGLEPGDRILFQIGNVLETVAAYYGAVKAGLIPVCTIPQLGELEMRYLARHSGAKAYLVQADFRSQNLKELATKIVADSPGIRSMIVMRGEPNGGLSFEELIEAEDPEESRRTVETLDLDPEAVAVFQLSGGTTGVPKIIPRFHCEYVYNSWQWAKTCGWDETTTVMHPIPLIHNAGIAAAMQPAHFVGAKFVVAPDARPETVLSLVEHERVNVLPVVMPAIVIWMLDHDDRARYDTSSLTHLIVGGQKLQIEYADRMEAELGVRCVQMFGMAEGMFFRTPDNAPEWVRKNTLGSPTSSLDEVRLLEPSGEDEVSLGELGELCCRGPYTIRGYYAAPEQNASAFTSDGFYRTGDVARAHSIEGEIYYSVEGRTKDIINRGAEKINAEEVEGLLVEHPAIGSVALVAMPDRELGERACVYATLRSAAEVPNLKDLKGFLLERGLTKFKLPERLEIVEELPVTNVGKVSKKELREDITQKLKEEGVWTPAS